jgi:hypothetical protein
MKKLLSKLFVKYGREIKDPAHGIGYQWLGFYHTPCCMEFYRRK